MERKPETEIQRSGKTTAAVSENERSEVRVISNQQSVVSNQ